VSEGYDKEKISFTNDELAHINAVGFNPIGSEHYGKESNFDKDT
jgi:dihydroorotate dehydrogenase